MTSIRIDVAAAEGLNRAARAAIVSLCEAAYGEDFSRLFEDFPGSTHVLARDDSGALVSHAAWLTRWLQPAGLPLLRTAYIEAVATAPSCQRRGYATAVLRHAAGVLRSDEAWQLAALSPSDPAFYARLGWELWQGPLAIRRGDGVEVSPPDEQVMILRLPRTPASLDLGSRLTAEWRPGELW
jgi:aminoglycoside 2'-N-acetyltransferase I